MSRAWSDPNKGVKLKSRKKSRNGQVIFLRAMWYTDWLPIYPTTARFPRLPSASLSWAAKANTQSLLIKDLFVVVLMQKEPLVWNRRRLARQGCRFCIYLTAWLDFARLRSENISLPSTEKYTGILSLTCNPSPIILACASMYCVKRDR